VDRLATSGLPDGGRGGNVGLGAAAGAVRTPHLAPRPEVARSVNRRGLLSGSAALGIASLVLPSASAAATGGGVSVVACTTPVLTQVPFVAQGSTASVGSVTVTAVTNTAKGLPDFPENEYWPHAPAENVTVLTFDPPVAGIEYATAFHGDAGGGRVETLTFVGQSVGGTELFSDAVVDLATTVQRPASGAFVPELARLTVTFTLTNAPDGAVSASRFKLRILTC